MAEMKRTRMGLLAATLLVMHLLAVSMAMSPTLHHLLHSDADAPDHQCAATLMIDGQVDRPDVACIRVPQPLLQAEVCQAHISLRAPSSFLDALPGGRAPPLA
jgi:hypothetical protein